MVLRRMDQAGYPDWRYPQCRVNQNQGIRKENNFQKGCRNTRCSDLKLSSRGRSHKEKEGAALPQMQETGPADQRMPESEMGPSWWNKTSRWETGNSHRNQWIWLGKRLGQPVSMLDNTQNSPNHVYYLKMASSSPIWCSTVEGIMDNIKTLINSGSSWNFIDISFAQQHNIPLVELSKPHTVIAIYRIEVSQSITHKVPLKITIEGWTFKQQFYVRLMGVETNIILGRTWLKEAKPKIFWDNLTLSYHKGPI